MPFPRTRTVALVLLLGWLASAAAAVSAAPWLALTILAAGLIVAAAAQANARREPVTQPPRDAPIDALPRVERFLGAVDRLPTERLRMLAVATEPDHEAAVERGLDAAASHGRLQAANDLRRAVDSGIARRFAQGAYDPTMFGLAWRSEPMLPVDRVRIAAAVRDAAIGFLVEDVVDQATFTELIGPCADLVPDG